MGDGEVAAGMSSMATERYALPAYGGRLTKRQIITQKIGAPPSNIGSLAIRVRSRETKSIDISNSLAAALAKQALRTIIIVWAQAGRRISATAGRIVK